MSKKYLVKPGYVQSITDGDMHFISFQQLCDLYQVSPFECLNYELLKPHGYTPDMLKTLIILQPRYDGNYVLPAGLQELERGK